MSSTTQTTKFNVWAPPDRRPSRRKTPPAPKPRNGLKHGVPKHPVATAHSPRRPRLSAHIGRSPPRSRAVNSRVLPLKPGTCASPTPPVPSQSPSQWKCRARRRGFTGPWPPIGRARLRLPQRRRFRQSSVWQADKTKHYTPPQHPSLKHSRALRSRAASPVNQPAKLLQHISMFARNKSRWRRVRGCRADSCAPEAMPAEHRPRINAGASPSSASKDAGAGPVACGRGFAPEA